MKIDQLINLLAAITLVEMMVTIGLGVTFSEVLRVSQNWELLAKALVANYVLVPGAAVGLLLLFHANPVVAAGLLVAAVCPGAPYGPPFTALAKGDVTVAVGLMVILAGASALVAPLLLGLLLPVIAADTVGDINAARLTSTLFATQLLPLCIGLLVRQRRPVLANRLQKPAKALSLVLNLLTFGVILLFQFRMLAAIGARGYFGMFCLVLASVVIGWMMGYASRVRKSMTIATSVRNVGVCLVIVTASFGGTAAVMSATAFGLFQTLLIALVALAWGHLAPEISLAKKQAA